MKSRFLQAAIDHLDKAIDGVEARMDGLREELSATESDYRAKDREVWKYRKDLSGLQNLEPKVEELRAENTRMKEIQTELDERLQHILEYTRSLAETLR